jgi:hypothetical protein
VGLVVGLLLGVVLGVQYFPSAGHDNGVRIEQSSSLSLVLWLALAEKLTGARAPVLGWITSIGCAALALAVVTFLARAVSPRTSPLAAPLLATSMCFLYWSTSGMETSMTALFGALSVLVMVRYVETDPGESGALLRADDPEVGSTRVIIEHEVVGLELLRRDPLGHPSEELGLRWVGA